MPNPSEWSKAIVDLGPFGVLAVLCAVCIYVAAKIILPWLDRKDDRHAATIKAITTEHREALGEQATEFRAALNHNTTALNDMTKGLTEVRHAVEQLSDRLDEHEASRNN